MFCSEMEGLDGSPGKAPGNQYISNASEMNSNKYSVDIQGCWSKKQNKKTTTKNNTPNLNNSGINLEFMLHRESMAHLDFV